MANELALINNIEKNLRKRNEIEVFPLTPTHRKELRELKNTNVGNLRGRIRTIRNLKVEEYAKKYDKIIQEQFKEKEELVKLLNDDWQDRLLQIKHLIIGRKKIEEQADTTYISIDSGYRDIAQLKELEFKHNSDYNRKASLPTDSDKARMLREQFDDKYGKSFDAASDRIDDMETKYEEAINFGNLEIVKELYYLMKGADSFFEKIEKLKI